MADEPKPVNPVSEDKLKDPACQADLSTYGQTVTSLVTVNSLAFKEKGNLSANDVSALERTRELLTEKARVQGYSVEKTCGATTQEIAMHNAAKLSATRNNGGAKP